MCRAPVIVLCNRSDVSLWLLLAAVPLSLCSSSSSDCPGCSKCVYISILLPEFSLSPSLSLLSASLSLIYTSVKFIDHYAMNFPPPPNPPSQTNLQFSLPRAFPPSYLSAVGVTGCMRATLPAICNFWQAPRQAAASRHHWQSQRPSGC